MKRNEADRLRDIANVLDDHCYDIYHSDSKQSWWFRWAATEIRKVIMDGGFNGITDEKYDRTHTAWELNKED